MPDLKEKLHKLNLYYRENGMTETIKKVNDKVSSAIRSSKYFFRYQYPSSISIEIMTTCNLMCRHCHLQAQFSLSKRFMEYELFEKIIQRISPLTKRVQHVNFASVEALFHKRIFDMIDLVLKEDKHINIAINTNGMELDEDCIENLLKRKIYNICISLDGCKKETVESFKTGVDFDKVVGNCKKLKDKGGGKVNIGTIFVAHKYNIDELMDYIDFCKNLGVLCISVTGFISYDPSTVDYCLYSERGIDDIDKLFFKAKRKAESIGIKLFYQETKLEPRGCKSATSTMYIDIDGNIVPCVVLARNTQMTLLDKIGTSEQIIWGNVFDDDPYKVWVSEPCVKFRRSVYEKKLPEECSLCALGYGVIC